MARNGNLKSMNAAGYAAEAQAVIARAVPGLTLAHVSPTKAHDVVKELWPHFPTAQRGSSSMFEAGWSFHAMDTEKTMRPAKQLAGLPALRSLLEEALVAMTGAADLGEETLNVICRYYARGHALPKHIDRPQIFDEDVYGCVLFNTSDQALEFEESDRHSGQIFQIHRLSETPGICFRQRGPARYEWAHGVKTLSHGERISVTWRWFDRQSASKGHHLGSGDAGKAGETSFGCFKGKGGISGANAMLSSSVRSTPRVLPLEGAEVLYFPACLTPGGAAELFEELDALPTWQKQPIQLRDPDTGQYFDALEGCPTISFSLPAGAEYHHSGSVRMAEAFPACVLAAKQIVEALLCRELSAWAVANGQQPSFNYCLAVKYENGSQRVWKHSDDEIDILPGSPIACLSLGATRDIEFEDRQNPKRTLKVALESGSVILMLGPTQERYQHIIRKNKQVQQARICLTFRMNVDKQSQEQGATGVGMGESKGSEKREVVTSPSPFATSCAISAAADSHVEAPRRRWVRRN